MDIRFFKSKWELGDATLAAFVERCVADGFDGTELFLPLLEDDPSDVVALHADAGLDVIAAIVTDGATPDDHLASLERGVAHAEAFAPRKINAHVGRDLFSFDDNVALFERAVELSRASGIPVLAETHRSRPTFSAMATRAYLERVPDLRLTFDVSHWFVVHESDLSDQPDAVAAAIARADHIHARVGHAEGPQIPDPRDPRWRHEVDAHVALWTRVRDRLDREGAASMTITPEFGPVPYMPVGARGSGAVADPWEANVAMRDLLRDALGASAT